MTPSALLFSLLESHDLAASVSRHAGLSLSDLEERNFEGGEFKIRPLESVRDRSALVFQCLAGTPQAPVCERLVKLLFLLYGLRDAGAARRIALLPYLTFARKIAGRSLAIPSIHAMSLNCWKRRVSIG